MLDNFPEEFRRDDEKVLNEFRQKQVNFNLEERKNEINSSRSLFIGALTGLIMAGVVGWFVLAPRYQNNDEENVPVIARPQTPVKVQPAEPGDVEFAAQERTVYDIIEKRPAEEESDKIVTSEEELNTQGIEQLVEKTTVDAAVDSKTETLTENVAAAEVSRTTNKAEQQEISIDTGAKDAQEKPVSAVTTKDNDSIAEIKEVVKEKHPVAVVEEKAKDVAASASEIKKGNWQVQLMSSPNKSAVEKSWVTTQKKYSVLQGLPYEVEKADLGAKGIYYRLKVGSFADKGAADALCTKLKNAGGSCFVAKK